MGKRASARTTASSMLVRQWRLLLAIQGSRAGISVAKLVEETGIARATVYRYLGLLESAGVPLQSVTVNGEARYRFLRTSELPPLGFSALQIAALHLARQELAPLAGAVLVRELDALLEKLRPVEPQQSFRFASRVAGNPHILSAIERSLKQRRRARIQYRAATRNGVAGFVHIEPLLVSVADGTPYVRAYCLERAAERTYKVSRIALAELTDEPFTYQPSTPPADAYAHAVKAWSGDHVIATIRLDPAVAWLASEYPLVVDQKVEPAPDGSVTIRARVAGIQEATRWTLAWGGAAEALEPPELRAATQRELTEALSKYHGPGPTKASTRRKSPGGATTRLAQGENRRG